MPRPLDTGVPGLHEPAGRHCNIHHRQTRIQAQHLILTVTCFRARRRGVEEGEEVEVYSRVENEERAVVVGVYEDDE